MIRRVPTRRVGSVCPIQWVLATAVILLLTDSAPLVAERLDFDTIFAPGGNGRVPTHLAWAADGKKLAFFFEDGDGKGLWLLDADGGAPRLLRRASDEKTLDGFHWAPDGTAILIESAGDFLLLDVASGSVSALLTSEAREEDPQFSPDGSRVAFVRDADMWLIEVASGRERRLTADGKEDSILNGKTDWVYWEELWNRDSTGFWWSPDGNRIAFYRFDESPVGVYPLVDESSPYPAVKLQKYPTAGTSNPLVRVGVLSLDDTKTTWLDTGSEEDVYLPRVDWLPGGDRLAVQRLNREQNRLDILLCSPTDGACAAAHSEEAATWVNVSDDLRFFTDGRFLWSTERRGRRTLELRAHDGSLLRDLAVDGWTVDHLDAVVEEGLVAVWTGYQTSPLGARHRVVIRQSLADGGTELLTDSIGWRSATVSETSGRVALISSNADDPRRAEVLDAAGRRLLDLPTAPPVYDPNELPQWEFLTIPGPDGVDLPAALLKPADLDSTATYPALMYHYGGPASQVVSDSWGSRGRNQWHKMMAQRGYVVLSVDNVGSNFFGKNGADRLHRRFGEHNLAAQLAGVRYLEGLGYVDGERIGLWGWSGGGANTLYSILNSPGTWKAAVAGAPVTDWHLYDTIWTERYLDHPADNPNGYEESSAVTYADRLADALLIVHGTADDNVHPQNTLVMSQQLIAASKSFEQAIHPGQKHGFRDPDSRHFYERMTAFFDRHLK